MQQTLIKYLKERNHTYLLPLFNTTINPTEIATGNCGGKEYTEQQL
jgi:hypothetical protein